MKKLIMIIALWATPALADDQDDYLRMLLKPPSPSNTDSITRSWDDYYQRRYERTETDARIRRLENEQFQQEKRLLDLEYPSPCINVPCGWPK